MKYIDSSSRSPSDALGTWLGTELTARVTELRWQSGFFSADGLSPFAGTLERLGRTDNPVRVVVGSNDGDTLESHISYLARMLSLPRAEARLGVVNFSGGFYHPKTYHLRRVDGSQAAYVGSANLTHAGISSLHVEAGVLLDTRDGDAASVLTAIAESVDDWFVESRAGLELVRNADDVTRLTEAGILSTTPTPRARAQTGAADAVTRPNRPRLRPLVRLAPLSGLSALTLQVPSSSAATQTAVLLPSAPRDPYPQYVYFAPAATSPTTGVAALSGATLPSGYKGIIFRLTRDSARHWHGGVGTANISIPVATVPTLRFGFLQGGSQRPRAEYSIDLRFVHSGGTLRAPTASTNVMVYGFAAADAGHGDVRLVVPARAARAISDLVQQHQRVTPIEGDVALLEFPTVQEPRFGLTLLERGSPLFGQVSGLLTAASASNQTVGQGACWLPSAVSPEW